MQKKLQNALRVFFIGPLTLEDDVTTWPRNFFGKHPVTDRNNPEEATPL
jgi:hypothetical protein